MNTQDYVPARMTATQATRLRIMQVNNVPYYAPALWAKARFDCHRAARPAKTGRP